MSDDPKRRLIGEAQKTLVAMERVGFHRIPLRRMQETISWMEMEAAPEDDAPCPPHCCCCGPGDVCCDCGETMPDDYPDATDEEDDA